ncbi:MAG: DUF4215 domain-containing protein, partial [Myxococcota bacterium]|nr:DUF4215 domain-containing protein [Myxococcota bacterium]
QGYFYLDTAENALRVCIGEEFRRISTAICGDGVLEGGEQCDDANLANDDGCNAVCAVEDGFDCVGSPTSQCSAICGDGVRIQAYEACDDGNSLGDDGCNADCEVDEGWACLGALTSVCSAVCGDGLVIAPSESCDDGNQALGDGCSNTCVIETGWSCVDSPSSVCSEVCGDGIAVGAEACDDGNQTDCDGCSPTCQSAYAGGFAFGGHCLDSSVSNDTGGDSYSIPTGCSPYVPSHTWGRPEFETICNHFSPGTACGSPDTDSDAGLCSNHSDVIMAFEQNSSPDIWVHDTAFDWNPNTNSNTLSGNCKLINDSNTRLVFACE